MGMDSRMRPGWRRAAASAIVAVSASALLLTGCSGNPPTTDGSWRLVSLVDARGAAPLGTKHVTLDVKGRQLSGDDSCNHFSGDLRSTNPWKVSDLVSTAMGCLDGAASPRKRFADAFAVIRSASVEHGRLVLVGPRSVELRFVRVGAR